MPPHQQPVLVAIGDVACTQSEVFTPQGRYPLRGSQWIVSNNSATTEAIPTYAIVLTVIFVWFCLLGLLFLLLKERKTTGFVQVTVHGPGFHHATAIPISHLVQLQDIENRVSYVRSLVAALPPVPDAG